MANISNQSGAPQTKIYMKSRAWGLMPKPAFKYTALTYSRMPEWQYLFSVHVQLIFFLDPLIALLNSRMESFQKRVPPAKEKLSFYSKRVQQWNAVLPSTIGLRLMEIMAKVDGKSNRWGLPFLRKLDSASRTAALLPSTTDIRLVYSGSSLAQQLLDRWHEIKLAARLLEGPPARWAGDVPALSTADSRHDARTNGEADVVQALEYKPPAASSTAGKVKPKRATINSRMLETLQKDPEAFYWSARKWAECLGCALSTVAETKTWVVCEAAKARKQVEREMRDERRQSRSVDD